MEFEERPAHEGNYTRGRFGEWPQLIVVHLMAGTLEGTAAWFANPASRVSAHYGVGSSGRVQQYVEVNDTAWHAGDSNVNKRSIGIEHEGDHGEGYWVPSSEQLAASVELAARLCHAWGIEPSRRTILLHSDVNPKKPVCPGPGWSHDEYIELVARRLDELRVGENRQVRLLDPVSNTQVGEGTFVAGTDKVYVKRLGPLSVAPVEGVSPMKGEGVEEDGMRWFVDNFYTPLWERGGVLGKAVFVIVMIGAVVAVGAAVSLLMGTARAQQPELLDPRTWFTSADAVVLTVGLIMSYLVKLGTALGKDWFKTSGSSTVALSAIFAVLIGGYGGYQALGAFGAAGGGIAGALQAVVLTLVAFFASNGSAKAERQALAGAVLRVEADEAARAKARLL